MEHRNPKARYRRTSKKYFVKQITQIERRIHKLRLIRRRNNPDSYEKGEVVTPELHHHIGKSQNDAEHIGTFLSKNAGDPAVKVIIYIFFLFIVLSNTIHQNFLPDLKEHLLPRLKDILKKEALTRETISVESYSDLLKDNSAHTSQLFFKQDRLYKHRIFKINYTTYDVRRAQDVINPNTSHMDIMVLNGISDESGEEQPQRFLYARVIRIYHCNVVFTGPGSLDYQPRRMEFLWVRWFQPSSPVGWGSRRLECVTFYPVEHEHAFGFLDPNDVLRSCHILPRQALGKSEHLGLSNLAKDNDDWKYYYVNRYLLYPCYNNIGILMFPVDL